MTSTGLVIKDETSDHSETVVQYFFLVSFNDKPKGVVQGFIIESLKGLNFHWFKFIIDNFIRG